jgi:hypothetical protein
MKRIVLLVTLVAVVMVATVTMAGTSFAQENQETIGSCFSGYATSEPFPPPGPGFYVSRAATSLASPGEGTGDEGTTTDDVAQNIGLAQQARKDVCPGPPG